MKLSDATVKVLLVGIVVAAVGFGWLTWSVAENLSVSVPIFITIFAPIAMALAWRNAWRDQ